MWAQSRVGVGRGGVCPTDLAGECVQKADKREKLHTEYSRACTQAMQSREGMKTGRKVRRTTLAQHMRYWKGWAT